MKKKIPDIDECKEGIVCQCDGCSCKDTWGGYECKCKGNQLYIMEHDTCIGKKKLIQQCLRLQNLTIKYSLWEETLHFVKIQSTIFMIIFHDKTK